MTIQTIWTPSQNYSPGPRMILAQVIHSTEGELAGALAALRAPGGPSAHHVISRDGVDYQMVPEEDVAYHVAAWGNNPALNRNRPNWLPAYNGLYSAVNACAIGYELVGYAATGFTEAQYRTLGILEAQACQRWGISATLLPDAGADARIVTHGWLQTDRSDPGPLFDWEQLRAAIAAEMREAQDVADPAAGGAILTPIEGVPTVDRFTDVQLAAAARLLWRRAPFDESLAISAAWLTELKAGRYRGVPTGPEKEAGDGVIVQRFTKRAAGDVIAVYADGVAAFAE